jgi:serine/threonine protein kinase
MDPEARLGSGRYVVAGLLGEGSQGRTYEATDTQTGRAVAIKRFDVRGARSWKDVDLAEREARVLATLDHPLVPRYLGNFEEDGALFLVMEKVEGETLEAMRRRQGALPEVEVRRFLACADRALTYLHGRGAPVVHRDIKPGNVVRRPDGTYVLVDFGAVSESLTRRASSTVVGTIGYMAPEQLQGRSLPASDVYAVGATALAALTGRDPGAMPHRGLRVDVAAALAGRASPALVQTLERMLEPDPDRRASSIAAALDPATAGPASPALAASPIARPGEGSNEDDLVKSLRKLLWTIWGIGWAIVPLVLGKILRTPEAIPVVMFGWMTLNIIAGWHRGALLRALIRQWNAEGARGSSSARARVHVDEVRPHVRVDAAELGPEDVAAGTEVHSNEERRRA